MPLDCQYAFQIALAQYRCSSLATIEACDQTDFDAYQMQWLVLDYNRRSHWPNSVHHSHIVALLQAELRHESTLASKGFEPEGYDFITRSLNFERSVAKSPSDKNLQIKVRSVTSARAYAFVRSVLSENNLSNFGFCRIHPLLQFRILYDLDTYFQYFYNICCAKNYLMCALKSTGTSVFNRTLALFQINKPLQSNYSSLVLQYLSDTRT